jgi:hypothetical protein
MGSGLNSFGDVVGLMTTPSGFMNAFSFSASGVTKLTANTCSPAGEADRINDAGQIAGTQQLGGQFCATVWNNGVGITPRRRRFLRRHDEQRGNAHQQWPRKRIRPSKRH